MRKILIYVTLLAAMSVTAAQVRDAQARDIVGQGTASCGKWTEDQRDSYFALIDGVWLAGYLSAYSVYNGDQVDLPDVGGREGWVSNYCRNHPLDKIYKAADQLILELIKRQPSQ
jgi:hypothetical protein